MRFEHFVQVVDRLGIDKSQITRLRKNPNQLVLPCPLAKWMHENNEDAHPSMTVKLGTGNEQTKYYCFTCHSNGFLWTLVNSVGSLANDPALLDLSWKVQREDKPSLLDRLRGIPSLLTDPPKKTSLSERALDRFPNAWNHAAARNYLQSRNITEQDAEYWDLRVDPVNLRVIFPVRSPKLKGAVGRALSVGEKYHNYFNFTASSTLGGYDKFSDRNNRLAVVEGFFDLINVSKVALQFHCDVTCTWHSRISKEQLELITNSQKTVYNMFDLDEAGKTGWEDFLKKAKPQLIFPQRVVWDNPALDPGDMSELYLRNLFARIFG